MIRAAGLALDAPGGCGSRRGPWGPPAGAGALRERCPTRTHTEAGSQPRKASGTV